MAKRKCASDETFSGSSPRWRIRGTTGGSVGAGFRRSTSKDCRGAGVASQASVILPDTSAVDRSFGLQPMDLDSEHAGFMEIHLGPKRMKVDTTVWDPVFANDSMNCCDDNTMEVEAVKTTDDTNPSENARFMQIDLGRRKRIRIDTSVWDDDDSTYETHTEDVGLDEKMDLDEEDPPMDVDEEDPPMDVDEEDPPMDVDEEDPPMETETDDVLCCSDVEMVANDIDEETVLVSFGVPGFREIYTMASKLLKTLSMKLPFVNLEKDQFTYFYDGKDEPM